MPKKSPPLPPKEGWNAPPGGSRAPREEWEPQKPKDKPGGMFPIAGQAREEWEPQQNPGIVPNIGNPRSTDEPDIEQPVSADTRTTGLRKGGAVTKVKKYDDGGDVSVNPVDMAKTQSIGAASNYAVDHPPLPVVVGPKVTYPTGQSDQLGVVPRGFRTPPPSPGAVRMQQSNPNLEGRAGGRTMGAIVKPKAVDQAKGGAVEKSGWRKYGW